MNESSPVPRETRPRIAAVVPCYRVRQHILGVIAKMPPAVTHIYCVDDACIEASGDHIEANCRDDRITVLRHATNQGVGGAMITGYRAALADGADIIVKIDGDGQMDPVLVPKFIAPITAQLADYTKGNRFYRPESLEGMPPTRLFGNALLSFLCKLSSGYWNIFDPNNGFTAIHANVLTALPLDKLSRGYFYEADMLFRLSTVRAVVVDIPMDAVYGTETSSLRILKVMLPMLGWHSINSLKRLAYSYFLRDFHVASIEWLLGPILLVFGTFFGLAHWYKSSVSGEVASAGTVMISALPVLIGVQMLLSAINYDISNVPHRPIHPDLGRLNPTSTAGPDQRP